MRNPLESVRILFRILQTPLESSRILRNSQNPLQNQPEFLRIPIRIPISKILQNPLESLECHSESFRIRENPLESIRKSDFS